MRTSHILILAAAIAAGASPAAAQFTGVVAPPKTKPTASAVAAVAANSTRRDSSVAHRLREMKAWVDSAAVAVAAVPARDTTAQADTARAGTMAAQPAGQGRVRTETATGDVTTYRNGSPAPSTATALPFILLVGGASLLTGAWLLRR